MVKREEKVISPFSSIPLRLNEVGAGPRISKWRVAVIRSESSYTSRQINSVSN